MKPLSTFACGALLLTAFSLSNAQNRESALARVNEEKNQGVLKHADPIVAEPVERAEPTAPDTKFILPSSDAERSQGSLLDTKVGPNGEDLFMKNNKYFYINGKGEKVKVKRSALMDKAKTS
jgi:hypothetical protein